jgi:hypothetical protein
MKGDPAKEDLVETSASNGSTDSHAFHRFMTEGKAYLEDSQVPRSSQVRVLARHLKGKAHDFYTRQVSDQPGEWGLSRFVTELFNYCFPLDYRSKQWKKLYCCYQGDKRVRDYMSELNELWMMIGDIPDREKVVKFWFGLNPTIQKELYKCTSTQRFQHCKRYSTLRKSLGLLTWRLMRPEAKTKVTSQTRNPGPTWIKGMGPPRGMRDPLMRAGIMAAMSR